MLGLRCSPAALVGGEWGNGGIRLGRAAWPAGLVGDCWRLAPCAPTVCARQLGYRVHTYLYPSASDVTCSAGGSWQVTERVARHEIQSVRMEQHSVGRHTKLLGASSSRCSLPASLSQCLCLWNQPQGQGPSRTRAVSSSWLALGAWESVCCVERPGHMSPGAFTTMSTRARRHAKLSDAGRVGR